MKNNIFAKGALMVLACAGLASCSSDYLNREPITYVDETTVNSTTYTAQRALWGVCRSMYYGYSVGANVQFLNGEAWINTMYGEVYASDAYYTLWQDFSTQFMRGDYLRVSNYWMPQMPWMYSYNLINQCNKILQYIDGAEGTQQEREWIKAQALTIRAHAYTKLIQFYAPRWEDSNNGETEVAPIRLVSSTDDVPLSTMKQILDRITDDLDEAIRLYSECGKSRTYNYEPNIEVAQGIYARIALVTHDWATARQMAHDARKNHPIMTADQYLAGFNEPNKEWMWNNMNISDDDQVGTFSWGALYSCNGGYVANWGFGAGAINYDLYKQMDSKDIRRALYWTPDKPLVRPVTAASFWNEAFVDETNMNLNKGNIMADLMRAYFNTHIPGGDISKFSVQAYRKSDDPNEKLIGIVPFGAQIKFWGAGPFSNSSVPFMRGAEMAFIEAEAAYEMQDEETARTILKEVNSQRVEGYTTDKTGEALRDEIRLSKRLELWGEGFCWTDLKRWKLPMVRRGWVKGDRNSNNIPPSYATTVTPDEHNGWRIIIPDAEVNYNDLITRLQQ